MRNKLFLLIILTLTITGCKKEIMSLNPTIELKKYSNVENQNFNLDTISSSVIKGENGTIIHYKRKDFNLSENEKVTLILKEFYSFEDLFFNNINTVTDKSELLESSGVLFVSFMSGDKKIELKENSYLKIEIPEERLNNNDLFSAKIDTLGQFEWTKLSDEHKPIIEEVSVVEQRGEITLTVGVMDTIGYYSGEYYKLDSVKNTFLTSKLDWINIDKIISNISNLSFELNLKNNDIEVLHSYIVYQNYNSFISRFGKKDSLFFKNIPFIKDSTSIIVVGFKNNQLFADKVELTEKKNINMDLKETTEEELKKMIKK